MYNNPFDNSSELDNMANKINLQTKINNNFDDSYIKLQNDISTLHKKYPKFIPNNGFFSTQGNYNNNDNNNNDNSSLSGESEYIYDEGSSVIDMLSSSGASNLKILIMIMI